MAQYGGFDVSVNDKFEIMITGMTGSYNGVVTEWDNRRNGPIIKAEGFSLDLKPGDYILLKKLD